MGCLFLALFFALIAPTAHAQIPSEWQAAAKAVIGRFEDGTPQAQKPWGPELRQGWRLARAWRQHNNGNVEIILAEYLTFTLLCRDLGCSGETVGGRPYTKLAAEMKTLRGQQRDSYTLVSNVHAWLSGLADPSGATAKNVAMWSRDPDAVAADVEKTNLYALYWILARRQPTSAEQASTFARFALFVQQKAWIGTQCLDISHVATVLGAPPDIESCKQ
jgi:hypothetical protein